MKKENQEILSNIWTNFVMKKNDINEEEAAKIVDYGVKFLDIIAKLAIDEQMNDPQGFTSFERNVFNSVSELLDANFDEYFYKAWRESCKDEGRIESEMSR